MISRGLWRCGGCRCILGGLKYCSSCGILREVGDGNAVIQGIMVFSEGFLFRTQIFGEEFGSSKFNIKIIHL